MAGLAWPMGDRQQLLIATANHTIQHVHLILLLHKEQRHTKTLKRLFIVCFRIVVCPLFDLLLMPFLLMLCCELALSLYVSCSLILIKNGQLKTSVLSYTNFFIMQRNGSELCYDCEHGRKYNLHYQYTGVYVISVYCFNTLRVGFWFSNDSSTGTV